MLIYNHAHFQSFLNTDSKDLQSFFTVEALPRDFARAMIGHTWYKGCPIPLDDLRLVWVIHVDFTQRHHLGAVIVHHHLAREVKKAFMSMWSLQFPIESVWPAFVFNGSDEASMVHNNTSAFSCRLNASDPQKFSRHAYGSAIDINPLLNPMVLENGKTLPDLGVQYRDRENRMPGLIWWGSPVFEIWRRLNWSWGGGWPKAKDYQHFQKKYP